MCKNILSQYGLDSAKNDATAMTISDAAAVAAISRLSIPKLPLPEDGALVRRLSGLASHPLSDESLASALLTRRLQEENELKMSLWGLGLCHPNPLPSFSAQSQDLLALNLLLSNQLSSQIPPLQSSSASELSPPLNQKPNTPKRSTRGRKATFPLSLHEMLADLQKEDGGEEIASFLPNGRAFVILKPKLFAETIMPKYFRMNHFSSFQRQLNLYEFQRIKEGPDRGAYYHELFVQDKPDLCKTMRRVKIKGQKPY